MKLSWCELTDPKPRLYPSVYIYKYKNKAEPVTRVTRGYNIFAIVCALVCLFASLIPPILGYFSFRNLSIKYTTPYFTEQFDSERIESQKKLHTKHEARLHYRQTNELTEYVEENGNSFLYNPDKSDQLYIQKRQYHESIRKNFILIKKSVFLLLIINILTFFGFLLFVRYSRRETSNPEGTK